jgi:NADH:ubiquinone oxidoreductase subunit E/ferredoxin
MTFIPVIMMVAILGTITILLAIADKLLVSYGECKIAIKEEDSTKEFVVQGGVTLLSALIANGVKISAPCGGRGSCGYCKVALSKGGGEMLPTEEIFISKKEAQAGTRLACQVKVKEDIDLFIPDLITSVKTMVNNGTFDTKLKWKFLRTDKTEMVPVMKQFQKLDKKDRMLVEKIQGAIMPVLQSINEKYNYLPEQFLRTISKEMDIPMSAIFRIATFYNTFSLTPRGKFRISICTGTACHVKGAANILQSFEEQLGIKTGETTEDMHFTLEAVRCIGCCGLAPVLTVNKDVFGLMTKKKVPEIIEKYKGA